MSKEDENFSLKDVIVSIQGRMIFFWKNKWYVLLAGALGVGLSVLQFINSEDTYSAEFTYMINEDDGDTTSGIGTILGQFGLGGSKDEYNLEKIVELSSSLRIVKSALFDSIVIDEKVDNVANHLIMAYDYHKKWKNELEPDLRGFTFTHTNFDDFGDSENTALKTLYLKLIGNPDTSEKGLISAGYREETGILKFSTETVSEELSAALPKVIYEKISTFYIINAIEKQQQTYNRLNEKVDSIRSILNQTEYRLSKLVDRSAGIFLQENSLERNRLMREVQGLIVIYSEVLKNKETSAFMLSNSTPFFQIIDQPILPILVNSRSILKAVILGGLLGGVVSVGILGIVRIFRVAMSLEE
jgi:hypothetical protein